MEKSFALELLEDSKKRTKRLFIVIVILIISNFLTLVVGAYFVTHCTFNESTTNQSVTSYNDSSACINDTCNNDDKK